jgi:hypothetical protein
MERRKHGKDGSTVLCNENSPVRVRATSSRSLDDALEGKVSSSASQEGTMHRLGEVVLADGSRRGTKSLASDLSSEYVRPRGRIRVRSGKSILGERPELE